MVRQQYLLVVFILLLVSPILADRGASWDETCENNICTRTLYSGTMFIENESGSGNYKHMTEVVDFEYKNDLLILSWWDKQVVLKPYIEVNGSEYNFTDIPATSLSPNAPTKTKLNFTNTITNDLYSYYYDHRMDVKLGNSKEEIPTVTKFGYKILKTNAKCDMINNQLVCDEINIDLGQAVREQNLTLNSKSVAKELSEVSFTCVENCKDLSYIDPTVTLQDADTENLEDTTIDEGTPNTNYGSSDELEVGSVSNGRHSAFVKFNITGITNFVSNITNATLYLRIGSYANNSGNPLNVSVYEVSNQTWAEDNITFNNKPSIGSLIDVNDTCQFAAGWISWDVTSWVNSQVNNDKNNLSLYINFTTHYSGPGNEFIGLRSKEYATVVSYRPYLKITYSTLFNITLNYPDNNSFISNSTPGFNFTVIGTDDTYDCELFINDTGYGTNGSVLDNVISRIINNVSLSDGIYDWFINCTASSIENNSETRIITIDTEMPSITINKPISNTNYTTTNTTLNITATDTNLDTCWYSIDSWVTNTTFNYSTEITFIANHSSNILNVACNDTSNNINNTESVTFYAFTPPAFISPTPVNDYNTNGSNNFNISVDLNWSSTECKFEWNQTTNTTMNKINSTHFELNKVETTDGNYSYRVICESESNSYWSNSSIRYIYINVTIPDTTAPNIYNIAPTTGTAYAYTTTSVTMSFNTNEQAICGYFASDVNFSSMTQMSTTNGTTHSQIVTTVASSSYTYYFRCNDTSGNENNVSSSTSFTVGDAPTGGGGGGGAVVSCGDGVCEYPETVAQCPADCGNFTFELSVNQFALPASPGELITCWGGCDIRIDNTLEETITITITIESNDGSHEWATINTTSFQLVGNSQQIITFNGIVPENTTFGEYLFNIKFTSEYYTASVPVYLQVGKKGVFSVIGDLINYNVFTFNTPIPILGLHIKLWMLLLLLLIYGLTKI